MLSRAIKNIQDVVAWRMCAGCGTCVAACDKAAVELVNLEAEGIRPRVNPDLCDSCAECLMACPGYQVDGDLVMDGRRKVSKADHEFGQTLELWEGYAVNSEIRHQASSGGVLSALAVYCLEHEHMGFVLHAGMDPDRPWLNRTFRSRTRDDIFARTGSRYSPASPCEGLRWIEESDAPCVFIGKPCDAAGATMLRRMRPDLDQNLGLVLTFFCAGTPSTRGTLDLVASLGVTPGQIDALRYRGEGWPGRFKVLWGSPVQERSVSYTDAWGHLTGYAPLRCRLCAHGLGRVSDIACGDAWESYQNDGAPGRSLVLVRTAQGREILHRAMAAGYVKLEPIGAQAVLAAQPNLLKRRRELFGRLLAMRLFGIPTTRFTGFSLFRSWMRLSISRQARSVLGTMRRIAQRGLWRRQPFPARTTATILAPTQDFVRPRRNTSLPSGPSDRLSGSSPT